MLQSAAQAVPMERSYRYRIDTYFLWATPALFALLGGYCAYFALTNREPVYLQGIPEFPPLLANLGIGAMSLLFVVTLVANLLMVVQAMTRPQFVTLTADALLVPRGFWSTAVQTIAYRDIIQLTPHVGPDGARSILVMHRDGKYPLTETMLPSKEAFEELSSLLHERVADACRARHPL